MDSIGQRLILAGILLGIVLVVCLTIWCIKKRKRVMAKVNGMSVYEKAQLLNSLLEPFGYFYYMEQDLVLTRVDAWQRQFGYEALYDRMAAAGNMIFQCYPIYFDYQGKTWLMEIWKGQYGITSGCEIGLYHADGIVEKEYYDKTRFASASNEEMQDFAIVLEGKNMEGFVYQMRHWWLAAFRVGEYHKPKQLWATYQIRFRDPCMLQAVLEGLQRAEYPEEQVEVLRNTLVIRQHKEDAMRRNIFRKAYAGWVLFKNRCFVWLFRGCTLPFKTAVDQILFLYFAMPSVFRRMFSKAVKGRCGKVKCPVRKSNNSKGNMTERM